MNLSPEKQLIACCAGTSVADTHLDRIRNLIDLPLKWEEIVDYAISHDIAALVFHNLKTSPQRHHVPGWVLNSLEKNYHRNIAVNMLLYADLKKILENFKDRGIDAMVLKGAALAKTVYGDIGLRPMRDIDILVRQKDLQQAHEIMCNLGYINEITFDHSYHLATYHRTGNLVPVEVHWQITGRNPRPDIDKWWERSVTMEIDGHLALVPCPEDMIIHLCIHLYNHVYSDSRLLKGLCDISETLQHYEDRLSWDLLMDTARSYKLHKPVFTTLCLAADLLTCRNMCQKLITKDKADKKLLAAMQSQVFADDTILSHASSDFFRALAADTFREKLKILLPLIFPSRLVMSEIYSVPVLSSSIFVYYLLRPFQLISRYWRFALGLPQTK